MLFKTSLNEFVVKPRITTVVTMLKDGDVR